jgi:hypothetical protein
MKFFLETTEWNSDIPNHTYALSNDKSKLYGYVRAGTNTVFKFTKPIGFNTKGRKFKEVKNTWGFKVDEEVIDIPRAAKTWEVVGSKGDKYTVTNEGTMWICSCQGFTFRGKCKHVDEIKGQTK